MSAITPCPSCGTVSSENYAGTGMCWSCLTHAAADSTEHNLNGSGPSGITAALAASRVDLLELIENGIPERQFLPGTGDALVRGKRHHIAGSAKAGKSLSIGVVTAIDIVLAGGVVVVLDRENGAEEYARRLNAVLHARNATPEQRELVRVNYRYHAWPTLKLEWGKDPAYPQAFAGADVVIFDSSRKFLTNVALTEDASDDYSKFTEALIDPLMAAGIATVILDNTGHDSDGRPRGTSSKADLCDVMFALKALEKYSLDRAGKVELVCTHSRLGELTGTWTITLGNGTYGHLTHVDAAQARQTFEKACIAALTEKAPQGRDTLIAAARALGAKGRTDKLRELLAEFVADETSPITHTDDGYTLTPGPNPGPPRATPPAGPPGPALGKGGGGQGGPPARATPGQGHPKCCCRTPDEPTPDGRCGRCWGTLPETIESPPSKLNSDDIQTDATWDTRAPLTVDRAQTTEHGGLS